MNAPSHNGGGADAPQAVPAKLTRAEQIKEAIAKFSEQHERVKALGVVQQPVDLQEIAYADEEKREKELQLLARKKADVLSSDYPNESTAKAAHDELKALETTLTAEAQEIFPTLQAVNPWYSTDLLEAQHLRGIEGTKRLLKDELAAFVSVIEAQKILLERMKTLPARPSLHLFTAEDLNRRRADTEVAFKDAIFDANARIGWLTDCDTLQANFEALQLIHDLVPVLQKLEYDYRMPRVSIAEGTILTASDPVLHTRLGICGTQMQSYASTEKALIVHRKDLKEWADNIDVAATQCGLENSPAKAALRTKLAKIGLTWKDDNSIQMEAWLLEEELKKHQEEIAKKKGVVGATIQALGRFLGKETLTMEEVATLEEVVRDFKALVEANKPSNTKHNPLRDTIAEEEHELEDLKKALLEHREVLLVAISAGGKSEDIEVLRKWIASIDEVLSPKVPSQLLTPSSAQ
jgi:hypothetical protein